MDILNQNLDKIVTIIALLVSGLVFRQAIIFSGQTWIKTFSHTITIILLPVITYVITSVITNNIALALGMVGALSIVRFRNPVKSPFELVVYFTMITAGIAASVALIWLAFLMGVTITVLLLSRIFSSMFRQIFKRDLFTLSFSEGQTQATLEIKSKGHIRELEQLNNLISFIKEEDIFTYCFASPNKNELLSESSRWRDDKRIIHLQYNE